MPRGRYWRSNLLVFSFDPRCQGDRLHHQIRITRPSDGTIERRIRNSTKGWLQLRMRWRTHKELEPLRRQSAGRRTILWSSVNSLLGNYDAPRHCLAKRAINEPGKAGTQRKRPAHGFIFSLLSI